MLAGIKRVVTHIHLMSTVAVAVAGQRAVRADFHSAINTMVLLNANTVDVETVTRNAA